MKAIDRLVLPSDLMVSRADSFPSDVRGRLGVKDNDCVITRRRSRARSLVVDAGAAAFLEQFRSPSTVIDAVVRHADAAGEDPTDLLEAAVPLVLRLRQRRLMAVEGDYGAAAIHPAFTQGSLVAGVEIISCVHLFEDVEVYRARLSTREYVALKIQRSSSNVHSRQMLDREAAILAQLAGVGAPRLVGSGEVEGRPYLLQSWCEGLDAAHAAATRRSVAQGPFSSEVLALCADILRAYSQLHANGIVHGDVHPGNVRVGKDGSVTLLDFGIAESKTAAQHLPPPERGGLHEYLEPEYCAALLRDETPPPATLRSDQYALGALLYLLITGTTRQEFSLDRDLWLRQVAEGAPLPFAARRCTSWPEMESVLARALAPNPSNRFDSTDKLLSAFESVSAGRRARNWSPPPSAEFLTSVLKRLAPGEFPVYDRLFNSLSAPRCSINYGAAGIAWFLYRTACMRGDPRLLAAADVWCTRARELSSYDAAFANQEIGITHEVTGGISPFHCLSGTHLVQAHVNRAMGDVDSARRAAGAFVDACSESCDNPDLTLGWASVLLGCAALTELLADQGISPVRPVLALGKHFADRISRWMATSHISGSPIRWLGLAHGWAGLLFGLLRWTQATGELFPPVAQERLLELATVAERRGEAICWPVRLGKDAYDRGPFTGWCHGSAGYVLLWTLAHRIFRDDSFLMLARGAGSHIAASIGTEEALDPSLCCGFAGQAFALMALHRATGEAESLRLAGELCECAVQVASHTNRPNSLFKGDVGVALVIQELTQPLCASMPLVETEGW